jgi:glycosyltransferase involved in cell wall biosynthesis
MPISAADSTAKKTISIITPCYNEEGNVLNLYNQVREVMVGIGKYEYEHIFIDNSSRDNTVAILKMIAAEDPNVKIIVNSRNFGHIRSPIHGLFSARGDAMIGIVADLQDPPPMIADLIREWENGAYCVIGIKRTSEEKSWMFWLRKQYYKLAERLSSIETIQNYTGFGLYDRKVVDLVKSFDDPYPYFRGLIAEIGLPTVKLLYDQPARKFGVTKNNWYTLYDIGMLGIINNSKVPLRLATFAGFLGAALSFLIALGYLLAKLLFWSTFVVGVAPMIIGVFFIQSLMLIFLGIMGEYVGAIYTQLQHRPYAVELFRENFDHGFGYPRTTPVALNGITSGNPLAIATNQPIAP